MARPPAFDPRLLGGMSPAAFLAGYWQQKPLLIRGAVADLDALPTRDDLFELAARDDVESRVVATTGGEWTLAHGPFARLPRRTRDWTLLVQGVNLIDAEADALMRRFDFVSTMRLDDLMMSYAVDGGGVGPHVDAYDVFLLQTAGRRRWRWTDRAGDPGEHAFVDGVPVKLLRRFASTDEAILAPGDMLYLPPSCAHEGVAVGPCITASIGFRSPDWNRLTQEFLFAMAERAWPDGRFGDAGRRTTKAPGALDPAMLAAIGERLARVRFSARDVETFVGRHFSEPKPHVAFDPPSRSSSQAFVRRAQAAGLVLDLRTTMLHRGRRVFVAGEAFEVAAGHAAAFRRLADRRRLDRTAVAALLADDRSATLLHDWWQHGWILFDDGEPDGAS